MKSRAHGLNVKRRAVRHAEPGLHACRGGGECQVGRGGRDNDEIDLVRTRARCGQCAARGGDREVGSLLAFGGDVALTDTGALDDPFVGRINHLRQLGVGQHAIRQTPADAGDH